MPYIIDGNNLIGSFSDIDIEDPEARRKLIEILRKFQENKKSNIIIVFDGQPDAYSHKQPLSERLTVVYPKYGNSADDEIKKILNSYTYFKDVVLVSSDRELKSFARKKGAKVVNSTEFHYELKRSYRAQGRKEDVIKRIHTSLSNSEVDKWMNIFNQQGSAARGASTLRGSETPAQEEEAHPVHDKKAAPPSKGKPHAVREKTGSFDADHHDEKESTLGALPQDINRKTTRFSVIGAGNVGTNLINSLFKKGYDFKYIYKKARYDYFAQHIDNDIGSIVEESDIIFIATQESKITQVAELIARQTDPTGKIFFHTANSLTSDRLGNIAERGGSVASFSPLQTFVDFDPEVDLFTGIYFLAEGDEKALAAAAEIAKDLGADILFVNKEEKAYLHIAAVAVSNFLVAILKYAEAQLQKCSPAKRPRSPVAAFFGKNKDKKKFSLSIMLPLIKQTLENAATRGVANSLSGPLKRKEFDILKKHLALLDEDEAEFYKILTDYLKK